jgi:hypothetical protein
MAKENIDTRLYIIGNGFDRHHDLATSFYDFKKYITENDSELYFILESYFSYPQSDNDLWCRFEENLANLDVDLMLSDNTDYLPNIASDDFRTGDLHAFPDVMDHNLEALTKGLITIFTEFIRAVEIPRHASSAKIRIDKNALFFTFNYTYTLEDLYGIDPKKILHIHNDAESRYDEIILGHGMNPDNFKDKDSIPPENLSEEEFYEWKERQNENWDYSYDTGKETILRYFKAAYKPTKKIIDENEIYFNNLSTIREVLILGHSLSEVDLPYIKKITKSVAPESKWIVSYYDENEIESHKQRLLNLGIREENIKLIEIEQLQISNRQLQIKFIEEQ